MRPVASLNQRRALPAHEAVCALEVGRAASQAHDCGVRAQGAAAVRCPARRHVSIRTDRIPGSTRLRDHAVRSLAPLDPRDQGYQAGRTGRWPARPRSEPSPALERTVRSLTRHRHWPFGARGAGRQPRPRRRGEPRRAGRHGDRQHQRPDDHDEAETTRRTHPQISLVRDGHLHARLAQRIPLAAIGAERSQHVGLREDLDGLVPRNARRFKTTSPVTCRATSRSPSSRGSPCSNLHRTPDA